jgi:hypothetical protein
MDDLLKLQVEFENLVDQPHNDWYTLASMLLVVEATQQPLPELPTDDGDDPKLNPLVVLRSALITDDCPASFQEWAILRYADYLHLPVDTGRLALHMAMSSGKQQRIDTALVLDLLEASPAAAGIRDAQGNLPLHLALQRQYSSTEDETNYTNNKDKGDFNTVLWALINAHPEAIMEVPILDETMSLIPYIWSRLTNHDSLFRIIRATTSPRLFAKTTA